jgi:hypothetical protein
VSVVFAVRPRDGGRGMLSMIEVAFRPREDGRGIFSVVVAVFRPREIGRGVLSNVVAGSLVVVVPLRARDTNACVAFICIRSCLIPWGVFGRVLVADAELGGEDTLDREVDVECSDPEVEDSDTEPAATWLGVCFNGGSNLSQFGAPTGVRIGNGAGS